MPTLRYETVIRAPADRCFDLARSVDLHVDSSTEIAARAVGGRRSGLSELGDSTVWSARFLGVRFRMTTRIEQLSRPTMFSDVLTRGLLRRFEHVYRFESLPDGSCLASDELRVESPFGPLGRLAERLYLTPRMSGLVQRRLDHVKRVAEGENWERYVGEARPLHGV